MYKPTINTSYKGVCRLYETCGRSDYCLRAAEDILFIHGFDIRKTPGYEDLTSDQKDLFAAHCVKYMNSVGMNTKITMYPFRPRISVLFFPGMGRRNSEKHSLADRPRMDHLKSQRPDKEVQKVPGRRQNRSRHRQDGHEGI